MINVKGMVITTVQTLAKVDPWDLAGMRFGTVILDEAHHAPASTFQAVLGNIACDTVYGLTATPNRDDGWTPAMYAWLGPKRYEVQARDLQRVGLTMAPTVCEVVTPFHSWSGDFTTIVSDLTDNAERNALIAQLVAEHGTFPQLVLTSRVEHAEALAALIPDAVAVVGRTRDRDAAFARVRAGEAKVLIATQLADEGLDLPGRATGLSSALGASCVPARARPGRSSTTTSTTCRCSSRSGDHDGRHALSSCRGSRSRGRW
jgi:superfamily II DNA or RNA helicase